MSDNAELFDMQEKIKNGDKSVLSAMYKKLFEIAFKTINAKSCENEKIAGMSKAERQQKAHDAATYIIEQYLKRPEFRITKSMTGYLYRRVNYELHGRFNRNCDKLLIFTDFSKDPQKKARTSYRYIVEDIKTGTSTSYESAAELYLNPAFKGLRKKRLAECIRTGRKWKNYIFDLLEVNE
jgi:hypothetical protein